LPRARLPKSKELLDHIGHQDIPVVILTARVGAEDRGGGWESALRLHYEALHARTPERDSPVRREDVAGGTDHGPHHALSVVPAPSQPEN
jgi:hypothetical protein